jgi:hypothetical protein
LCRERRKAEVSIQGGIESREHMRGRGTGCRLAAAALQHTGEKPHSHLICNMVCCELSSLV